MAEAQSPLSAEQQAAYTAFRLFEFKLTELLPDELSGRLSQGLVQARIIPSGWKGGSKEMMLVVSNKIKYYPKAYDEFLTVLEKLDKGYFGDLICEMREEYTHGSSSRSQNPTAPLTSLPSRMPQRKRTVPAFNYSDQQFYSFSPSQLC